MSRYHQTLETRFLREVVDDFPCILFTICYHILPAPKHATSQCCFFSSENWVGAGQLSLAETYDPAAWQFLPSGYDSHSHGKSSFLIGKLPSINGPWLPWLCEE